LENLKSRLRKIEGKGYKAYKSLKGIYNYGEYQVSIDHVSSDPFAPPSRFRLIIDMKNAGFPEHFYKEEINRIATEDFITRLFSSNIKKYYKYKRSTGNSGLISIQHCGQEIYKRTSVKINESLLEIRFEIGLPAGGRRINAKEAEAILFETLPKLADSSLYYNNIDKIALLRQNELVEDQTYLRKAIKEKDLIVFIANDSVLPRESGISDAPMKGGFIKFKSPHEMEYSFTLPNSGTIKGMGIKKGVTLIVGGGFHGKSTLLNAIELGVYNHISGDGREYIVTEDDAVKIRAEDGRSVCNVDIRTFINNIPNGKDTACFTTNNASGSTSQAANIMEAIEAGTGLLLIDEDTSATNFMIRDIRMQRLVVKEKEPITPFIDRVKALNDKLGISTIMVVGGSGEFFDVADRVIMMDEYIPCDVTDKAKKITEEIKNTSIDIKANLKIGQKDRIIKKSSFKRDNRGLKIKARSKTIISVNRSNIEMQNLEQLVDINQTNTIANTLLYIADNLIDNEMTVTKTGEKVLNIIKTKGLEHISPFDGHPGNMSEIRLFELIAALNRYRNLIV
jgi:predicted ABC-class ATPase